MRDRIETALSHAREAIALAHKVNPKLPDSMIFGCNPITAGLYKSIIEIEEVLKNAQ